jgi:hypothetical protein
MCGRSDADVVAAPFLDGLLDVLVRELLGDYKLVSQNVELRAATTEAAVRRPQSSFRRRLANTAVVGEAGFFLPTRK